MKMLGVAWPRSELAIIKEASKEEVEGIRRHVEMHSANVSVASVKKTLWWARSVRLFKKRASKSKSKSQDMRSMLIARLN